MDNNRQKYYPWVILVACCLVYSVSGGFTFSCFGTFIKPVTSALGFSRTEISLVLTISGFANMFLFPLAGKLIKRYRARQVMVPAIILSTVAFGAMGSFGSNLIPWYISALGIGLVMPFITLMPCTVTINNWFKKQKGLAMGVLFASFSLGNSISTSLSGLFITNYGWETAFRINAIIALCICLPVALFVMEFKPSQKGLKAYGETDETTSTVSDAKKPALGGISFKLAKTLPLFYLAMFGMFLHATTSGILQHLVPMYSDAGFDLVDAANYASLFFLVSAGFKVVLGIINDKFGVIIGTATITICSVLGGIFALNLTTNPIMAISFAVLWGMGLTYTVQAPLLTVLIFGEKDFSPIYSIVGSLKSIANAISVILYGALFDLTNSYASAVVFIMLAYAVAFLLFYISNLQKNKYNMQIDNNTDIVAYK